MKCKFIKHSYLNIAMPRHYFCYNHSASLHAEHVHVVHPGWEIVMEERYNISAGYYKSVWITTIVLSSAVAYLLLVQILYLVVNYSRHNRHMFWFDLLCVITSLFTYCRLAVPHYNERLACGIIHDIVAILFYLSYFMIWSTLWMRQHYFYKAPTIRKLFSKWLLILSYGCEVVIVLVFVTEIVEYAATRYLGSDGCVHDYFEESMGSWLIVYLSCIIFQSILIGLLVYPLWRQYKKNFKGKASKSVEKLRRLLSRTAMASATCAIVNAASLPINIFVVAGNVKLQNFVHNINLVIQLLTLLVSFRSWKSRIFLWKIKKQAATIKAGSQPITTLGCTSRKSVSCEIVDLRHKT